MVIIYKIGPWYREEGPSSDKLKDKTAKFQMSRVLCTAQVELTLAVEARVE
jgi:hypothetical protein